MEFSDLNFKIVYTLVSGDKDTYAEQCILSVYSLRKIHPKAWITLVMDDRTRTGLNGVRSNLIKEANEVKVMDFDEEVSPMVRSRVLKTSLRQLVDGDYLYIDTDTVIVKSLTGLNALLESHGSLWAVQDGMGPFHVVMSPGNTAFHSANADKIGYNLKEEDEHFFNGGAMLVRDDATSHQFYRTWNHNYFKFLDELGIKTDQATLALSNKQMEHVIQKMPIQYNFQLSYSIYSLEKAAIIHYFATGNAAGNAVFPLQSERYLHSLRDNYQNAIDRFDQVLSSPVKQLDYIHLMYCYVTYNPRLRKLASTLCRAAIRVKLKIMKK